MHDCLVVWPIFIVSSAVIKMKMKHTMHINQVHLNVRKMRNRNVGKCDAFDSTITQYCVDRNQFWFLIRRTTQHIPQLQKPKINSTAFDLWKYIFAMIPIVQFGIWVFDFPRSRHKTTPKVCALGMQTIDVLEKSLASNAENAFALPSVTIDEKNRKSRMGKKKYCYCSVVVVFLTRVTLLTLQLTLANAHCWIVVDVNVDSHSWLVCVCVCVSNLQLKNSKCFVNVRKCHWI